MFKKLQTRFILCYLLAVFAPIILLSIMIYRYHTVQQASEFTSDQKYTLIIEQNLLENQLNNTRSYYNQMHSNSELQYLIKGFYTSERELVYAYNSQIYSLLNSILYDNNLSNITIYTENKTAADILKRFEPIEACPVSAVSTQKLINGQWLAEDSENGVSFSFYIGFRGSLMTRFAGIAKITYNSTIFDSYAADRPDSSVYVYLNDTMLYFYNSEEAEFSLERYKSSLFKQASSENPSLFLDEKSGNIISCFTLNEGVFRIIKITPAKTSLFSYRPFIVSLVVSALILVFASVAIFLLLFRAMNNIILLAEHMNRQNTHTLIPYSGSISSDETGELALAFNQMSKRINELSSDLLNNEMQLRDAQIEALQAQLNPHFFYGTLESIRMIAEANHQELISDITFSFASLMRYSLSQEYLAPVKKELEITRQYISIQEKRLLNRFDIEWQICELDDKWRCPKFTLFTMVENVFSHNVNKCREFIHIYVSVYKEGTDLVLSVRNTGPGIAPERLRELQYLLEHPKERTQLKSENNGRGIFNINDRLKLFYGENYLFTIDSKPNVYTICSIRVHK